MSYDEKDEKDSPSRDIKPVMNGLAGFSERLREIVAPQSLRGFSKTCGLSEATLRSYLLGETYPTLDRLQRIAQASNASAVWLAFGHQSSQPLAKGDQSYVYIPLYDAKLTTSLEPWTTGARVLALLPFLRQDLESRNLDPTCLSAVRVDGDAMVGLLHDGDIVLINHCRNRLEGEGVYVLLLGNHLYPKRLQRQFDGSVHIINQNKEYQSTVVPREALEDLHIIGRVIWDGGWR